MSLEKKESSLINYFLIHALKLPLIYFIISICFNILVQLNSTTLIQSWKLPLNMVKMLEAGGHFFILLAVLTFIYRLITSLCCHYEKKLADTHTITSLVISIIRRSIRIIFFLLIINIGIMLIEPAALYIDLIKAIINIVVIISIGWITIQIFYTLEAISYRHMLTLSSEAHSRAKALYTKTRVVRNIATVVIVIITFAMILMSFSSVREIGISLLASAGFLTAIIGLAAQKTLFSLFSGLQIILSQSIKIGDIIFIENQSGSVEEITFTYVTLRLGENRRLIIPITYFIEKPFENWSHDEENNEIKRPI